MQIGIIVTTHQGKLRPNGQQLIKNFVESCKSLKYNHKIYVFDNASEEPIKLNYNNVELTYIKDQTKRGLTGTWNDGTNRAYFDNCDIILVSNDDVTLNSSVNTFIDNIKNNNTLYGPVSNGILAGPQLSNSMGAGVVDVTNRVALNGFFFGFTRNFINNYIQKNGFLFNENYPWGGNEEEFQSRIWKLGANSKIIKECYLEHIKIRGWKQLN
tara:strand:+ start:5389 stop:6027 length:639 start_codon:yes stop_codon:yes gene_type:complete